VIATMAAITARRLSGIPYNIATSFPRDECRPLGDSIEYSNFPYSSSSDVPSLAKHLLEACAGRVGPKGIRMEPQHHVDNLLLVSTFDSGTSGYVETDSGMRRGICPTEGRWRRCGEVPSGSRRIWYCD